MKSLRSVLILLPALACGRAERQCDPVPGAEALLRAGVVVLLGEIHGTAEAPAVVSRLVCQGLDRGLDVTVGLEIPRTEQGVTDAYLLSDGGPEDEGLLLASNWWRRDYQDGRSSRAMFDLLRDLRRYGTEPARLHVLLIDEPAAGPGRDRTMATLLRAEIAGKPESLLIVLTGNLHNRLMADGTEPMGYQLRRLSPGSEIVSLDLAYSGGTAWVCTSDGCGAIEVRGKGATSPGVELYRGFADSPYTGRLHVGKITASPPAMGL